MNDLISRQAAIDAICKSCSTEGDYHKCDGYPETSTWCDELVALRALPSAQPEQRWIPCSERLPEESGRYLVSVLDGVGRRTTVAPYQPRYKAWTMTGRMAYWKVIAWMPLSEPYQAERREE